MKLKKRAGGLAFALLLCMASWGQGEAVQALDADIHMVTLDRPALMYQMIALEDGSVVLCGSQAQESIVFDEGHLPAGTVFEAYAVCIDKNGEKRWDIAHHTPDLDSSRFTAVGLLSDGRPLLGYNINLSVTDSSAIFIIGNDGAIADELPIEKTGASPNDSGLVKVDDGFFLNNLHLAGQDGDVLPPTLYCYDESFEERFRLPLDESWKGWGLSVAEGEDAYYLAGYYYLGNDTDGPLSSSRPRGTVLMKVGKDGTLLWEQYGEAMPDNNRQYRNPMALVDGGFAYIDWTSPREGVPLAQTLKELDGEGNLVFSLNLPGDILGLLPLGNGYLSVAYSPDTEEGSFGDTLVLTYLDREGRTVDRRLTLPENMASTPFSVQLSDGGVLLCVATTSEPSGSDAMHFPYTYRYVRVEQEMFEQSH